MNAIANLAATPCADLGECLADLAVDALIDEAELSPKPALVDRRGNGAHADLHLGLMQASALSLWPCFKEMADAAQRHGRIDARLRGVLGQLGRDGEAAMLRTTEGVNTHRGAIWALGLLVAAAALEPRRTQAGEVAARAGRIALLDDPAAAIGDSHGERVRRRYGVGGAREEARLGFPRAVRHGLPQLWRSREGGAGEQNARLDALLAIMSVLDDTCVLHRAGRVGLAAMQDGARAVLAAGGSASLAGRSVQRQQAAVQLAQAAPPTCWPPVFSSIACPPCPVGGLGVSEMETLTFEFPAGAPARGRALAGCVGSGDLEVLLEPAAGGALSIQVVTSVNGSGPRWQQLFARVFAASTAPAASIRIHDFGATPGVVRLRLEQALEEAGHD